MCDTNAEYGFSLQKQLLHQSVSRFLGVPSDNQCQISMKDFRQLEFSTYAEA